MHILLIVNTFPNDLDFVQGIFHLDQAKALYEAGYQIGVLVEPKTHTMINFVKHLKRFPPILKINLKHEFPVYECYWGEIPKSMIALRAKTKLFVTRFALWRYIKRFGMPDVIHAHNSLYSGYVGGILGQERGIPVILTEHSSAFARGLVKQAQEVFVRRALNNAQIRLSVSQSLANVLQSYTRFPVIIQPNMVDTDFFYYRDLPDKQTFTFSIIAALNENKRHRLLIDAFTKVFSGKAVKLKIVGDGPLMKSLVQHVNDLSMNSQIIFSGWRSREEIRDVIHESHCIVSVSRVETFGLSLAEALSCGRPVVATRSGGPDGFINQDNGMLISIDDEDALAHALQEMYEKHNQYNTMLIRSNCVEQFSQSSLVNNLTQFYKSMLI